MFGLIATLFEVFIGPVEIVAFAIELPWFHRLQEQEIRSGVDSENSYVMAGKGWIHNNCSDKPALRRKNPTLTIQALYRWLDYFFEEITWDVPGAYFQVTYWDE